MSRLGNAWLILVCMVFTNSALAESTFDTEAYIAKQQFGERILVAQWEGDESYDPFADYSEFEETEEEEADINFFRNGRLFTIALAATYRGFTGKMGNIYDSATAFGLSLNYFFDLRFAIVVGFSTGESNMLIPGTATSNAATGALAVTAVSFNIKYFFNTQNVNRGLANLNPYMIGGITQFHRKIRFDDSIERFNDSAVGVDVGVGIELPLMRGQLYFGLQGVYHYVNFADENTEIILDGDATNGATGIKPNGDIFTVMGILGVNF